MHQGISCVYAEQKVTVFILDTKIKLSILYEEMMNENWGSAIFYSGS